MDHLSRKAENPGKLSNRAFSSPESGIVEVMNHGRTKPGLIPLWAGEGHLPTPDFIVQAANQSLADGETFYTYQRGLPELRDALGDYHAKLYGKSFDRERFYVTGSGMQSIQIALHLVADPGDTILYHEPGWPNLPAASGIAGINAVPVPMPMQCGSEGWHLDLDRLFDAVTERTRALFINSPSNPTGWVMSRDDQKSVLDFARKHGLWIIADEIYGRFFFDDGQMGAHGRPLAPSFLDIAEPDDRLIFVNTFSKNWAMTGWRIGWLMAPADCAVKIENLIQYSTSGVAAFMQRAAIAALRDGDNFSEAQITNARKGRDVAITGLATSGRCRFVPPGGAFYAFFSIEGEPDTDQLGLRLVDEAGIGLAPGRAFGAAGAGFMRMCTARAENDLREAIDRLNNWLNGGK